jgi:hypothetical protein
MIFPPGKQMLTLKSGEKFVDIISRVVSQELFHQMQQDAIPEDMVSCLSIFAP